MGNVPSFFEEEFDVVVLGFGGAGACAAIQAADEGARVRWLRSVSKAAAPQVGAAE